MKWISYKYQIINEDSSNNDNYKEIFLKIKLPYSESNIELVKAEAYNGEYTIEDDGQPEPEPKQTPEERIAELEEALALLLSGVTE